MKFKNILFCFYFCFCLISPGLLFGQPFLRGLFGLNEPTNFLTNTNEQNLLNNTNANAVFGLFNDQDRVEEYCRDLTGGNIKIGVEFDMIYDQYHILSAEPFKDQKTDLLFRYISESDAVNIQTSEIDRFVLNTYNHYSPDYSGIANILVSHQGHTDHATHWGFIEHACQQIQTRFGDNVRSLAITEVATSHLDPANLPAFVAAIPHLDIFMYECYPLSTYGTTTPSPLAYSGAPLQTALQMVVDGYTWCQSAFEQTGNGNTRWHAIIQVCEQLEYDPTPPPPANTPLYTYHRRPTEAEIFCQANLALSRGAKGIYTYIYGSNVTNINIYTGTLQHKGLVDLSSPRAIHPTYNHVANLFSYLDDIGPELITKTCTAAFNCNNIPGGQYLTGVTGYTNDGTTHTIEIGIFNDATYPNRDYFMLVNRLCSNDAGNPANPQVITLQTTRSNAAYRIRDVVTGETYVSYNGGFPKIVIGPGRARLFEMCPVFTTNETWSDSVHIYCDCTLPSDRTLTIQSGCVVEFDPVGDNSGGGRDSQRAELIIQGELDANGAKFTSRNTSVEFQDLTSGEPARLRKPIITAKSGKTAEAIRLSTALLAAKAGTKPEEGLLLQQAMLSGDDLKTAASIRDCSDDIIRSKSILSDFRECSGQSRTGPSQRDLHSQNSI